MTQLSAQRTLKGSSQSDAQLFITVTNHLPDEIRVAYFETMPWLLQFYLHTLRAEIDGRPRGMSFATRASDSSWIDLAV